MYTGYARSRLGEDNTSTGEYFTKEEKERVVGYNGLSFVDEIVGRHNRQEVFEVLDILPDDNCWIAGSSLTMSVIDRFEEANDIDVWFRNIGTFIGACNNLGAAGYALKGGPDEYQKFFDKPYETPYFTYTKPGKKPVQLIKMMWFDDVNDLLKSFDLTICQIAVRRRKSLGTGHKIDYIVGRHTLDDIEQRRLVPHRTLYPHSMMTRVKKYMDRGFKPLDGDEIFFIDEPKQKSDPVIAVNPIPVISPFDDPKWKKDYYGF